MEDKNNKANTGVTIFLFLIAIILIVMAIYQQGKNDKQKEELSQQLTEKSKEISEKVTKDVTDAIKENLATPPSSELPDYESLRNLKNLSLIKDFESWTPETKLKDDKIKTVIVVEKGKLAKGYIYIRASLDNKPLSQWESVYIKMNYLGGHLFRPQSLPLPKSDRTELLYSLNNVPYIPQSPYSEQATPSRANWFNLFQNNKRIEVLTFISSLRPAKIEEATLYYGCVDDNECSLSLSN